MVSNYDRIYAEISSEAKLLARELGMDPDILVTLTMKIVDLEDQHRIKSLHINQLVADEILASAMSQMRSEES
jgi:hypothetical protein